MRKPERPMNYMLFAGCDVAARIANISEHRPLSKRVPSALYMDAFVACDAELVGRVDHFSITHAAFCSWLGFEAEKIYESLRVSWVWYGFGEIVRILYDRLCDADQAFPLERPLVSYPEIVEGIAHEMDLRIQFRRG